ncbi:MAG: LytTR family transcriptional regulator, partial [Cyanobacteria bacterium J06649_11]
VGAALHREGKHLEALDTLFKVVHFFDFMNRDSHKINTYNLIGEVYEAIDSDSTGLKWYRRANSLTKRYKDIGGELASLAGLGRCFDDLQMLDSAIYYYRKNLELSEQYNYKQGIAAANGNLGLLFFELDSMQVAKDLLESSFAISQEIRDTFGLLNVAKALPSIYKSEGKYLEAINILKQAIPWAIEREANAHLERYYLHLSEIYEQQRDYPQSLKFLKKHISIRDHLLTTEKNKAIQELNTKYESARKDRKIAEDALEIAKQDSKIWWRNVVIFGALLLIILLILILQIRNQLLKHEELEKKYYETEYLRFKEMNSAIREELKQSNAEMQTPEYWAKRSIVLPVGRKKQVYQLGDIDYIEANNRSIKVFLTKSKRPKGINGKDYIDVSLMLRDIQEEISNQLLVRIHKSYIVNLAKIHSFTAKYVVLEDQEQTIPIGRGYSSSVKDYFNKFKKKLE